MIRAAAEPWFSKPWFPPYALAELRPNPLPLDEARLLPRARSASELVSRDREQVRALVDSMPAPGRVRPFPKAEPGDLRGIPALARGVGGVSPGTSPESAIARVDRQREQRRRAA